MTRYKPDITQTTPHTSSKRQTKTAEPYTSKENHAYTRTLKSISVTTTEGEFMNPAKLHRESCSHEIG